MKKRISIWLILCSIACIHDTAMAAADRWEFRLAVAFPNVPGADEVACGDIDGDGRIDILCSQSEGSQFPVRWYRNLGGDPPKWKQSERITPVHTDWKGEEGWMGSWLGDFDGDGDSDVVTGAKGTFAGISHPVCWYENAKGDGAAWVEHVLPVSGDYIDNCRSADFNGDGRDDIVVQKYNGSGVYLLACPAPADPRQSKSWQSHTIGKGGKGLSLADIDGDRRLDVLVDNKWFQNPGSPLRHNWPRHGITDAPDGAKNAAADLNGDGRTDIVLSSEEGQGIWWFEAPANPTEGKWIRRNIRDDYVGNHTLWLADFDRDGKVDILTAEMHTKGKHRVTVFQNAGGNKVEWVEHVLATTGSHNALAVDINADKRPDIVGCNFAGSGNPLEIWLNRLP